MKMPAPFAVRRPAIAVRLFQLSKPARNYRSQANKCPISDPGQPTNPQFLPLRATQGHARFLVFWPVVSSQSVGSHSLSKNSTSSYRSLEAALRLIPLLPANLAPGEVSRKRRTMNRCGLILLVVALALTTTGCSGFVSGANTSALVAPMLTLQPANQTVTAGQTATFSVTANGTAPLTYQWKKNGVAMNGAVSSSYTTPATANSDNGAQFIVLVSNSVGSVTSGAATLSVNAGAVAPSITTQPASQTVMTGQTATFNVAAAGTGPLSYQWQKNGTAIIGATSSGYTTPPAAASDNGA